MLFYIALFLIIGIVIGLVVRNDTTVTVIIFTISGIWLFVSGLWAIATFFELCIGYVIGKWIIESIGGRNSKDNDINLLD